MSKGKEFTLWPLFRRLLPDRNKLEWRMKTFDVSGAFEAL